MIDNVLLGITLSLIYFLIIAILIIEEGVYDRISKSVNGLSICPYQALYTFFTRINRQNKIAFYATLLFPLYYSFLFGQFIGRIFYSILIDNNHEDRLASWVV